MYFKAPDNSLHCLDNLEFQYLLPEGSVAITDAEYQALIPLPPVYPLEVSPRQIRQAMNQMNIRTQVETAVAAGDQNLKDWWNYATMFIENHPEVLAMAQTLNITDEVRHSLFELASTL